MRIPMQDGVCLCSIQKSIDWLAICGHKSYCYCIQPFHFHHTPTLFQTDGSNVCVNDLPKLQLYTLKYLPQSLHWKTALFLEFPMHSKENEKANSHTKFNSIYSFSYVVYIQVSVDVQCLIFFCFPSAFSIQRIPWLFFSIFEKLPAMRIQPVIS